MAECYKVATLDGLNKLSMWDEAENPAGGIPTLDAASQAITEAMLV
jgi:hypothetical protein